MLMRMYFSALGAGLTAGVFVAELGDRALSQVPCYRQKRDAVLDSLFGPAEEFEFVRPTTPL